MNRDDVYILERYMSFNDQFKSFLNLLSKFDKEYLIRIASERLHEIEGLPLQSMSGTYPWHLLLLIRWAVEYENKYQYYPHKIKSKDFIKFINKIQDMESEAFKIFFNKEEAVYGSQKFLRSIAFQQFWLQNQLGKWNIARQLVLLESLSENHPIVVFFNRQTNISVHDFLTLSSIVWVWCTENPTNIILKPSIVFSDTTYSQETINAYFNLLSKTRKELQEYLVNRKQAVKKPFLQFTEQTPFAKYPFLKINASYIVYSRRLIEETISTFIYSEVKLSNQSLLINQFADSYERYIAKCLDAGSINYYTENDLKKDYIDSKITDFLIPLEQCTVLLEAKAVDLRPSVKVYPANKQLITELRDSVVKAVIQAYHTAKKVSVNNDNLNIPCRTEFFLLIVTYRQLYMGSGRIIWEEFLKDAVLPKLQDEGLDERIIDPERIVVLSIEELELLMGVLRDKKVELSTILEQMVLNNTIPETSKLLFVQHFENHIGEDLSLPLLDDAFEKFWMDNTGKFRQVE